MTRILAIDPGPERSAGVIVDTQTEPPYPTSFSIYPNDDLLRWIHGSPPMRVEDVVIEKVASYGMPVGAEVFETVYWSGRFAEACQPVPVHRLTRKQAVLHLCNSPRGNDGTVRAALIDRFGGKAIAIGNKAHPGPLYGIKADLWAALAVAVTWADQNP